jgi:hypothetical protein
VAHCDGHRELSYSQSTLLKRTVCDVQFGTWSWDVCHVWEYDARIKHRAFMFLAFFFRPCIGVAAAGNKIPTLSPIVSQALAGSFQPSQAFN